VGWNFETPTSIPLWLVAVLAVAALLLGPPLLFLALWRLARR
jgi:hypothetical protein